MTKKHSLKLRIGSRLFLCKFKISHQLLQLNNYFHYLYYNLQFVLSLYLIHYQNGKTQKKKNFWRNLSQHSGSNLVFIIYIAIIFNYSPTPYLNKENQEKETFLWISYHLQSSSPSMNCFESLAESPE